MTTERNGLPVPTRVEDGRESFPESPDAETLPALAEPLPRDRHPVAVYLASLAKGSRRTMSGALHHAAELLSGGRADAESLDWSAVRYQHVAALRTLLAEQGAKPATVNKKLAAVRGVLRECWRLGLVTGEDFARVGDVKGVRATTLPAGRALSAEEVARMKEACDPSTVVGRRDRAALALMARAGLRRAELVGLDVEDFRDGLTSGTLVVRGKGSKERLVPLTNGVLDAVRDWIEVRGAEPGALLPPVRRGGSIAWGGRLTTSAVWKRLRDIARGAGIGDVSPHDLRRTACTALLDAGVDLGTAGKILGHASVETTKRYDRRDERAMVRAAALVPF